MRYLGIDPGKTGGLALLDGASPFLLSMPDTEHEIVQAIKALVPGPFQTIAMIEKIQPHWGHDKTGPRILMGFHKLAISYGFLRGTLSALGIPFDEVPPHQWRKLIGVEQGADGKAKKQKAQQLYPNVKITLKTADALLIATVCQKVHRARLDDWKDI